MAFDIPQQVEESSSGDCCVSAPLHRCVDSRLLGIVRGAPARRAGLNGGVVSFLSQDSGFAGLVRGRAFQNLDTLLEPKWSRSKIR